MLFKPFSLLLVFVFTTSTLFTQEMVLQREIISSYNEQGDYLGRNIVDYKYDANGFHDLSTIVYCPFFNGEDCNQGDSIIYHKNASGQLLQSDYYYYNSDFFFWILGGSNEYTYDAEGRLASIKAFDGSGSQIGGREIIYNEFDQVAEVCIDEEFDFRDRKLIYSYDDNMILQEILMNFPDPNGEIRRSIRTEITYDAEGLPANADIYTKEADSLNWIAEYQYTFIYDPNSTYDDAPMTFEYFTFPMFQEIPVYFFGRRLLFVDIIDLRVAPIDVFNLQIEYIYDLLSTTTENLPAIDHKIFPNPFVENFTVAYDDFAVATFHLYDLQGKKLKSKEIRSGDSMTITDLPQGYYIYSLTNENINQSGRLIKLE
ncbi:MAG: T9SS type A sorting domain-containing protein [Bacteroidota bacterium]